MLRIVAAVSILISAPAFAQQPPDEMPVTLTYGELNAIVQARVADALAGGAMRHLNEQLTARKPTGAPGDGAGAGRALPPPSPMPATP